MNARSPPPAPDAIAVIGLGYVGLPTAVAFARTGIRVHALDVDPDVVEAIRAGDNPLDDTPLPELADLVADGSIQPTTDPAQAIPEADAVVLAVPTPVNDTRDPDLSAIEAATRSIAPHLSGDTLIVLESTVYPGCTEETLAPILANEGWLVGEDVGLAYCPERLNPGDPDHTVDQLVRVLGATDEAWTRRGQALYERIVPGVHTVDDIETAEAAKVIENVQRDLNIALVNELSLIFDKLGLDVQEVLDAAATKWNFHRYDPGPGVGGHCLPVDPHYLTWKAESLGFHPRVILAGRSINDEMPGHVVSATVELLNELERPVNGTRVCQLGLAYKPDTGDLRNAPALEIADRLEEMGAELSVVDPNVADRDARERGHDLVSLNRALEGADLVLVVVDHAAFEDLSPARVAKATAPEAGLVDTVARFDPEAVRETGLAYRGIGRR
jgi:nucleotide sugar dehydrogenase